MIHSAFFKVKEGHCMNKIKELRESHNILQSELARVLKVNQGSISNWENHKSSPNEKNLIDIANFFNVSVDYILGLNFDSDHFNFNPDLNDDEKELLFIYRNISAKDKRAVLSVIRTYEYKLHMK